MTCFNCGQNGNGIVLFYGWWKVISERYHPKMIIYDITTDFDLLAGDNHKYLGWLKEAYDRNGVKEVFLKARKRLVKKASVLSISDCQRCMEIGKPKRSDCEWHSVL